MTCVSEDRVMTERTVDCRGLNCPLPIVRISQEVRTMTSGESLEVLAT
ncbi:MAG: sulfurtransferase TusA family protein, partial [Planctomycetaceae bacterium]|nr:sulfurtransferase TusA family protein [Planctomycetaceae bacterium]